jgi:Rha family phage regulatory protein
MNDLVSVVNGKVVVTSKQVADHFGRIHRDVMRATERLINDIGEEKGSVFYAHSSYLSLQNKTLDCYEMNRDGFTLLVMGFDGKKALEWKVKYMEAFNKMEAEILSNHTKEISVMDELNKAYLLMESDKEKASVFGSGLNEWKAIRKEHMERVNKLQEDVQMLLNFKDAK